MNINQRIRDLEQENATLNQKVRRLQHIIDQIPENIYMLDTNGRVLLSNTTHTRMCGYDSNEAILGKDAFDVTRQLGGPETLAKTIRKNDIQVMDSGKKLQVEEVLQVEGKKTTYLTTKEPFYDADGKLEGLVGLSVNITDRADEQLQYLQRVVNKLPECVYCLDTNGVVTICNEQQAKVFGIDNPEVFIGKTLRQIGDMLEWTDSEKNLVINHNQKVMQTQRTLRDHEHVKIEDEKRYFLSIKDPLINDKGDVEGLIGVSIDLTEQKKLEVELREAKYKAEEANRAKTTFLMNMSHDLRTPCSSILGLTNLLSEKETHAQKRNDLRHISASAQQLLALLNQLLEISRQELLLESLIAKKEPFELIELIKNIIDFVNVSAVVSNNQLFFDAKNRESLSIVSDERLIKTIVINLLTNATKFTENGVITISVDCISVREKDYVVLMVKDTGIGIAKEQQTKIFEKFSMVSPSYKNKHSGFGLGLFNVDQAIKKLGGTITLESDVNKGATFTVTLPVEVLERERLSHTEAASTLPTIKTKAFPGQGKKILLVEDTEIPAIIAGRMLRDYGFEVVLAHDGCEALNQYDTSFDGIVLDLGLPDYDANDLAALLVEKGKPNIPILGLTAHLDPSLFIAEAFDKVFEKPCDQHFCAYLAQKIKSVG